MLKTKVHDENKISAKCNYIGIYIHIPYTYTHEYVSRVSREVNNWISVKFTREQSNFLKLKIKNKQIALVIDSGTIR